MNIELSVKQRLGKVYEYLSITQTELARQIEVHPSQISILGTDRRPDISKDIARKISKRYTEIDPWWLITGEGEMLTTKKNEKNPALVQEPTVVYGRGGGALDGLHALLDEYEARINHLEADIKALKDEHKALLNEVRLLLKERTYLNAKEVAQLRALYDRKELKPRLQSTLRHFLFQVGTSLRYSDLVAITTDNIEGSLLIFQPEKTKRVGKVVKVPLSTMAKDMLRDSESTDNKLFPVHAEQVMNRFLKEISDYVGFSKKLTTHVGRHTFGYLFIAAGGQVEVLQKIMGHSDIKTTMIYTHIDTRQIRAGVAQLDTFLSTMAD